MELGWLPTSGKEGVKSIILLAIAIGWSQVAALMRLVRSSMLDMLDSEFVKLARLKGVSETKVIWKTPEGTLRRGDFHSCQDARTIVPVYAFQRVGLQCHPISWPKSSRRNNEYNLGLKFANRSNFVHLGSVLYTQGSQGYV